MKEGSNGLGMQLRLVAGPLNDAGAAAKICAVLTENKRHCETAIFDGQRLSLAPDDQPPAASASKPSPSPQRRAQPKRAAAPPAAPSSWRSREAGNIRRRSRLSSTDGMRNNPLQCNTLRDSLDTARGAIAAPMLVQAPIPDHTGLMKKTPFRLTPYQVQFLLVVGFVTVGYALYLRYLAVEFSTVALACDAGLQTMLCKSRALATYLFKNSVFGIVALIIATLHVMRPSIVTLTADWSRPASASCSTTSCCRGSRSGCLFWALRGPRPPQRKRQQEIDRAGPHRLPVLVALVEAHKERGRLRADRQRWIRRSAARPLSAG